MERPLFAPRPRRDTAVAAFEGGPVRSLRRSGGDLRGAVRDHDAELNSVPRSASGHISGYVAPMHIERIEVSGFGGLRSFEASFGRTVRVSGPGRARVALADALLLAFAAYDVGAFRALLDRWGCAGAKIEGEPLAETATWEHAPGLSAVVDRDNLVTVAMTILLDPPQFGKLRQLASRDPRLVDALADGARLTVRTGARFSPALDAVALDPLGFVIGAEAFAVAGADRPAWITPFLAGLGGRLWRGRLPALRWAEKGRSYAREDQLAVRRALAALAEAPAALGDALLLPEGPAILAEDAVVPVRHLGADAADAAGLIGAVFLSGAEILLLEDPPAPWLDWLSAQAEADGSQLEQVFLFGPEGGITLG